MQRTLTPHRDCPSTAVTSIQVESGRPTSRELLLSYDVVGNIRGLLLPVVADSVRADGLWQHTCFEAFVRMPSHSLYYEFNFAPSTQWAAYRFAGYRKGMHIADKCEAPWFGIGSSGTRFKLQVRFSLEGLDLETDGTLQLGLSAVIEEVGRRKSYWALAHPPGKPDFHHPDCFALDLPSA